MRRHDERHRRALVLAAAVAVALAHCPGRAADVVPDAAVRMDFPPAEYPDGFCEDELGNTYELPLQRYQAGMRPVGPCLPIGTWQALRSARPSPGGPNDR